MGAGKIAGLEVLRIINEPTAASLAYGFNNDKNETVLVFDLGGGTFDVSILEVGEGVFEVLSTSGDTHLGGDDFDKNIVDWLAMSFKKDEGIDLREDPQALQRLMESAEKAKIELSAASSTQISLPFITATSEGPKHIDVSLSKAEFEKNVSVLLDRCRRPVQQALNDANLGISDVQEVILVGGSTRIPSVQQIVQQLSGKSPNMTVNPDEVVAMGAALQAGVLTGDVSEIVLLDVTPLSLGVETLGVPTSKLIPRNTTVPTSKSQIFSTASDGQSSVEINVLQGEREFSTDNKSLGNFRLDGIPPAPSGVPQIEVRFDMDANCILSVTATDKGSGKKADIKITGASTLAKEDVERMVQEAERFAEEDKTKREIVDTKNQGDSVINQTRKQLSEFGSKLPQDLKTQIETYIKELEETIKSSQDVTKMKQSIDRLQQETLKIGKFMNSQPNADTTGQNTSNSESDRKNTNDDNVIDADFSEKK